MWSTRKRHASDKPYYYPGRGTGGLDHGHVALDVCNAVASHESRQHEARPGSAPWRADEHYAVALSLALLGQGDGINLTLAWAYVGIRVVHSLLQALINKIELRFVLFALSSLVLIGLTVNALRAVF